MKSTEKRLYQAVDTLSLVDTHEHMERTSSEQYPRADLFDLIQNTFYLWSDLVSSGMPPVAWEVGEKDDEKKWKIIRTHLPNVVNTGYYQGIVAGLRSLYDMDINTIDDDNWRSLNESIKKAYEDPLWPEKVLKGKTHIEKAINDVDGFNMNRSLFLPSIKFDYLLYGASKVGREKIRSMDGVSVSGFDNYVSFVGSKLEEFKDKHAVALKTVTPYYRGFDYDEIQEAEARRAFNMSEDGDPRNHKTVEDFMFHFVVRKAIDLDLPIQIHTGLLAWNTIKLKDCNPAALNQIFIRYPACRFILFHGGYPFADETGVLAKAFPNVFLDFCWFPWVSFSLIKHFLHVWLDIVPNNKLMWGGDAHRAECVHGHWLIARRAVVEVLSEKVSNGSLKYADAERILRGIFRNNAISSLKLNLPEL
jgi:predicted TIM-barrel fold metal-dependent hydrolase